MSFDTIIPLLAVAGNEAVGLGNKGYARKFIVVLFVIRIGVVIKMYVIRVGEINYVLLYQPLMTDDVVVCKYGNRFIRWCYRKCILLFHMYV